MNAPIRTGAALAGTAAIGYAACTLVFWLWPEAAANFMTARFHGLDFRRLQSGPSLFSFASFPDRHPEREMHGGAVPKGASHAVVALFDAANGERIATAEVTATVALLAEVSATRWLQPMKIADQPSFGGFFAFGVPGIYRLRFEARVPGHVQPASAEFEYRVSPEGRR